MLKPSLLFKLLLLCGVQGADANLRIEMASSVAQNFYDSFYNETKTYIEGNGSPELFYRMSGFSCAYQNSDRRDVIPVLKKVEDQEDLGTRDESDQVIADMFARTVEEGDILCILWWDVVERSWSSKHNWSTNAKAISQKIVKGHGYLLVWDMCEEYQRRHEGNTHMACAFKLRASNMWAVPFKLDKAFNEAVAINPNGKVSSVGCQIYEANSTAMCTFQYKPDLISDVPLMWKIKKPFTDYIKEEMYKSVEDDSDVYNFHPHCYLNPKEVEYVTFDRSRTLEPGEFVCDIRFYPAAYGSFSSIERPNVTARIEGSGEGSGEEDYDSEEVEGSGIEGSGEEQRPPHIKCPYYTTSITQHEKWCVH